jgi:hypothetical protein
MTDPRVLESSEKQTQVVLRYCAESERLLNEEADYATALPMKDALREQFHKEWCRDVRSFLGDPRCQMIGTIE